MIQFIKNLFKNISNYFNTNKEKDLRELANYTIVVLLSKWSDEDLQTHRTFMVCPTMSEYELKIKILKDYSFLFSNSEIQTIRKHIDLRFKPTAQ